MEIEIVRLTEVGSTNDYAKSVAKTAKEGTVIVAEKQTAGKGRLGRNWAKETGAGIAMSAILKPPELLAAHSLTLLAGLCVRNAVWEYTGLEPLIKWPNDVVIGGKKICGILAEASFFGNRPDFIVLGMGVNVNNREFPGELLEKATSLLLESGKLWDKDGLAFAILEKLKAAYPLYLERGIEGFIAEYREFCVNIGRETSVTLDGEEIKGVCSGVSGAGGLLLEGPDGRIIEITSGEASVRGVYGYV